MSKSTTNLENPVPPGRSREPVQALYQQQGRHLEFDLPTAPIYVDVDSARLDQEVINLLKYSWGQKIVLIA